MTHITYKHQCPVGEFDYGLYNDSSEMIAVEILLYNKVICIIMSLIYSFFANSQNIEH